MEHCTPGAVAACGCHDPKCSLPTDNPARSSCLPIDAPTRWVFDPDAGCCALRSRWRSVDLRKRGLPNRSASPSMVPASSQQKVSFGMLRGTARYRLRLGGLRLSLGSLNILDQERESVLPECCDPNLGWEHTGDPMLPCGQPRRRSEGAGKAQLNLRARLRNCWEVARRRHGQLGQASGAKDPIMKLAARVSPPDRRTCK